MDYQQQYIQLESTYQMNVSKLKTNTKELKVLERDPQRNAERILVLKNEVVEDSEIVAASKLELKKHRARMGRLAKTMKNVELRVFYYKYVRKYGLKHIAKVMGYSHSHIKRISAKVSKNLQQQNDET